MTAIAQNRDGVAEPENLLQPMRNVNDRNAALLQMAQQAKQVLAFADGQGAGRLVHDDELRMGADRGGDLKDLLLSGR